MFCQALCYYSGIISTSCVQAVNVAMGQLRRELDVRTAQANDMFRENAAVLEESRACMAQIAQQQASQPLEDRWAPCQICYLLMHALLMLNTRACSCLHLWAVRTVTTGVHCPDRSAAAQQVIFDTVFSKVDVARSIGLEKGDLQTSETLLPS